MFNKAGNKIRKTIFDRNLVSVFSGLRAVDFDGGLFRASSIVFELSNSLARLGSFLFLFGDGGGLAFKVINGCITKEFVDHFFPFASERVRIASRLIDGVGIYTKVGEDDGIASQYDFAFHSVDQGKLPWSSGGIERTCNAFIADNSACSSAS